MVQFPVLARAILLRGDAGEESRGRAQPAAVNESSSRPKREYSSAPGTEEIAVTSASGSLLRTRLEQPKSFPVGLKRFCASALAG